MNGKTSNVLLKPQGIFLTFILMFAPIDIKFEHHNLTTSNYVIPQEKHKPQFQIHLGNLVKLHVLSRRFNYQSDTNLGIPQREIYFSLLLSFFACQFDGPPYV